MTPLTMGEQHMRSASGTQHTYSSLGFMEEEAEPGIVSRLANRVKTLVGSASASTAMNPSDVASESESVGSVAGGVVGWSGGWGLGTLSTSAASRKLSVSLSRDESQTQAAASHRDETSSSTASFGSRTPNVLTGLWASTQAMVETDSFAGDLLPISRTRSRASSFSSQQGSIRPYGASDRGGWSDFYRNFNTIPGFPIADDARSVHTVASGKARDGAAKKLIQRLNGGLSKDFWMTDESSKEWYASARLDLDGC